MLVKDILNNINKILANSSSFKLKYDQLQYYIDLSVDYVNLFLKIETKTPQEAWEQSVRYDYIDSLKLEYTVLDYEDLLDALINNEKISLDNDAQGLYESNPKLFYRTIGYDLFNEYIDSNISDYEGGSILDFDYTELPEVIIRNVLIYYAAASYLEEEDEFESQYKAYKERAEKSLINIQHTYYSSYRTNIFDLDKPQPKPHKRNPYWEDDDN